MKHPISATFINWQEAHDAATAKGEQLRCCAPGCGDRIKEWGADQQVYRIVWSDASISYLEDATCVDWFVNGHPDYGCARGPVVGLPGCEKAQLEAGWANGTYKMWWCNMPKETDKKTDTLDADSQQAIASLIMGRMSLL